MKYLVFVVCVVVGNLSFAASPFKNLKWISPGLYKINVESSRDGIANEPHVAEFCYRTADSDALELVKGCKFQILKDTAQSAAVKLDCLVEGVSQSTEHHFKVESNNVYRTSSVFYIDGVKYTTSGISTRIGECK